MSNQLRFQVVEEAFKKKALEVPTPSERPSAYFGKYVFNREKMYRYLPAEVYTKLIDVIDNGARLDRSIADAVGLGAALEYLNAIGMPAVNKHEHELLVAAVNGLEAIDGIRLFGTAQHKSGVVSFLVHDINSYDMGLLLDKLGIAVRTGHHCAQPLMARYGVTGMVRASFAVYNTIDEVNAFVAATRRVADMLR